MVFQHCLNDCYGLSISGSTLFDQETLFPTLDHRLIWHSQFKNSSSPFKWHWVCLIRECLQLEEHLKTNFWTHSLLISSCNPESGEEDRPSTRQIKTKLQETISLFFLKSAENRRTQDSLLTLRGWFPGRSCETWLSMMVSNVSMLCVLLLGSFHIHRTLTEPVLFVILIVWTHRYLLTFRALT